ncbi:MAG: hypothetical protein KDK97_05185 [Verrucomicrobiales bacterium]|nr:hypothetical protein [Verrucomicrobiales bacterium]MCP5557632.1 hypothetical protein [Verrucomicrobiaceae bacterium]
MKTIRPITKKLCTAVLGLLASLAPVQAQVTLPQNVNFSRLSRLTRPTLVVLIHGGTSRPTADPAAWEPRGAAMRPGTLGYSRFYFDFPFVARVLGASTSLFTMQGPSSALTATTWKTRLIANAPVNQIVFPRDPTALRGRYNGLAAALVRANGSQSIGGQAKEVLDQIRLLSATFESFAGRKPYIVLAGHSKGGLVSRYLMSIPEGSCAGHNLSATDRAFLTSLRDQVKFCITIGSPHTGSPLADYAHELRTNGVTALQSVVDVAWTACRVAAAVVRVQIPAVAPVNLRLGATELLGDEADLGNLTTAFWIDHNTDSRKLHPARMVRTDGSRIPFYLYGGRSPGDTFFSTARFDAGGGPSSAIVGNVNHPEHVGVMMTSALMGLDYALHNVAGGDWGRILTVGTGKNLDIVRRSYPVWGLPRNRMSSPGERMFLIGKEGLPMYFLRNQGDRETDADGMVSIDSALGVGLFTGPITIEAMQVRRVPIAQGLLEPWDHTVNTASSGQPFQGGSWYRMYSGAWNFQNHSTLTKRPELGTEINRVLRAAGPFARTTGTLSTW